LNADRSDAGPDTTTPRPGRTFARVMIVQVITLALLWLLQSVFGQG
jgi:hypothetical protein